MRGKRVRGQLQRGAGGLHCMFGLQLYRLSPIVCRAPDWYLPPPTGNDMKSLTRWLIARMAARLTKSECKSNSCWHLNASMSSWIQHKLLKVAKAFKKWKGGEKWERPPRMKLPVAGSLACVCSLVNNMCNFQRGVVSPHFCIMGNVPPHCVSVTVYCIVLRL